MAGKREGSPTVGGATGNEKKKQRIDSFQYDQVRQLLVGFLGFQADHGASEPKQWRRGGERGRFPARRQLAFDGTVMFVLQTRCLLHQTSGRYRSNAVLAFLQIY